MYFNYRIKILSMAIGLLLALAGCGSGSQEALNASGVVEVTQVAIASETGGTVLDVLVDEGQQVQAGQTLVRLDAGLMELQLNQAQASLALAQAAYDQAAAVGELEILAAQQEIDELDATYNLAAAQAEQDVANARVAVREAQRRVDNLPSSIDDIDRVVVESDLALAEASLEIAENHLDDLRDGPDPDLLALAEARLEAAQAAVPLAEAQVNAAQAALDVIQAQVDKMEIKAPMSGVVLLRTVEPGEVVLPGAPLLTLGALDDLTVTVYIPEDQYGRIDLGDSAKLSADSFPDVLFDARVTHIADQAEYTPRNVQTEEDRRTTVFAIQLTVDDPTGQLKPGMPVDVEFP